MKSPSTRVSRFQDFRRASAAAHTAGAGVKAYLLLKPLFLTEGEAVADMKRSIRDIISVCGYDLHESLHRPAQYRDGVLLETGGIPTALSLECSLGPF